MTTYAHCTDDDLSEGVRGTGALLNAVHAQVLMLAAEVGIREAHKADGHRGLGSWLAATLGVSGATGSAWGKAAMALTERPHLAQAFASGAMSFDRLRPALALASTPELDEHWATEAFNHEVPALERMAREAREVSDDEDQDTAKLRRFRSWWKDERGKVAGTLTPVAMAKLEALMERLIKDAPAHPDGSRDPFEVQAHDAFEAMLDLALAKLNPEAEANRTVVNVHVDLDVLLGLRDGPVSVGDAAVSSAVLHKLCCDGLIETVLHDAEGKVVGIGRASRVTPQWLRRRVLRRDQTCRFPGCDQRMLLHAHHIRWWTRDGGPTDAPNLIALCSAHHALVHTGGWCMEGDAEAGTVVIRRPDGRIYAPRTDPLDAEVRARFLDPMPPLDHDAANVRYLRSRTCTNRTTARARRLRPTGYVPNIGRDVDAFAEFFALLRG